MYLYIAAKTLNHTLHQVTHEIRLSNFLPYILVFLDTLSSCNIIFVDQVYPDYLLNYFAIL